MERKRSFGYWTYGHPKAQEGHKFVLPWPRGGDADIIRREETATHVRFLIAPEGDLLFNRQWTPLYPLHVPPHLRKLHKV